ncbi:pyridoxal-phosphate-dependent aminotransferase family protein [Nitratiruptor sp. SB155-2]|uniref:pyridoxal-phosphate-dependent aminotransferase family protein n=1 Tax=Nitratiruptor sp. (strain SB155-2) TaxID=387092 RepID=UPI000158732F|nr:alanine--glyoxylate aminotransferase family protein [Nitratiruptor sp. SB155-2]BAF70733.1 aminotransferase [Nitratiruptor sp. SB155-2]
MLLFTPGPTPVLERVRQVMAMPTMHHRTPEFSAIFKEARSLLKSLLDMEDAVMLASTGTGAMEACVTNLCREKMLVVNAGKFGERFTKIGQAFGKDVVELKYEWDTPAQKSDILEAIETNPDIDALCIQICESAGGLRHPVEEIAAAVKAVNPDIVVIADGITAVGVEPINTENIDALITGSQKALMLPPGLAMVGLSQDAINRLGKGSGFYFNLASELKKQREGTTAYTAATTLVIGLKEMLTIMLKEIGMDEIYDQTDRRATATRIAMEALGLQLYPKSPANAMTAVYDEQAEDIRKILKNRYGVQVAGGQDHLKGKLFRINHMGIIEPNEAAWVVNAVEKALSDLGRIEYRGEANRIFNTIYFEE